jgi:erythritol transport system substrate-binding protein
MERGSAPHFNWPFLAALARICTGISEKSQFGRGFHEPCRTLLQAISIVVIASGMTGQAQAEPMTRIAIIVHSEKIRYDKEFADAARSEGGNLGVEIVVLSDNFDESNQIALFEAAVVQKYAAIVCTSVSKSLLPRVERAQHEGIVCVLVGEDIHTSGLSVVHIVANDYQGASAVAEEFAKLMGGSGKYAELMGPVFSANASIRSKGYNDTIRRYPDLRKVDAPIGDGERKNAFAQITSTIQRNPDIKGIICANDEMALGAQEALKAAGLADRCVVVGFDGLPEAIESIVHRGMQATVQVPVAEMARLAIQESKALIQSGKVEDGQELLVDCRVVNYGVAEELGGGKSGQSMPRLSTPVPDSPWPTVKIFGSLQANATRLIASRLTEQPEAKTNLRVIQDSGNYLEGRIKKEKVGPSSEYLYGLTVDAWELANAAIAAFVLGPGAAGWEQLAANVQQIASSVRSKVERAERNPADPFAKVAVKVVTKDTSNAEVLGLDVTYCLKGLMPYPDRYHSFDHFSSPTTQGIPPGNYEIWASRAGKKGAYKDVDDVGGDGESEKSIDVAAP